MQGTQASRARGFPQGRKPCKPQFPHLELNTSVAFHYRESVTSAVLSADFSGTLPLLLSGVSQERFQELNLSDKEAEQLCSPFISCQMKSQFVRKLGPGRATGGVEVTGSALTAMSRTAKSIPSPWPAVGSEWQEIRIK